MSEKNYSDRQKYIPGRRYRGLPRKPSNYVWPHLQHHSIIRDGCDTRLLRAAEDDPLEGSPLLKILEEMKK